MVSLISFTFLLNSASCSTPMFCAFVYVFSQAPGLGFVGYEIHAMVLHISRDASFFLSFCIILCSLLAADRAKDIGLNCPVQY